MLNISIVCCFYCFVFCLCVNSRIRICSLEEKYIVFKIIIGCIGFLEMVNYCIGWVLSYYSEQPLGVTLTEYCFHSMNVIGRYTFDVICFWVDLWFWCPLDILIVWNGPWDYPLNLQRTLPLSSKIKFIFWTDCMNLRVVWRFLPLCHSELPPQ